jgi:two-component system sensor histidine kinase KdpD
VTNLLDMSRIEAGAVEATARHVGLDEVTAAALASIGRVGVDIDIDVDVDLPAAIADAGLFERVVANLLTNAVEHAPAHTTVRIEAASLGDRAMLRVIDHGPGVAEEQRDQIFDPFQRLGDNSGGGVGLGLAVAKGFMTAMGGDLSIDQTPGGGLTVTLRLPLAAPQPPPRQPPATEVAP